MKKTRDIGKAISSILDAVGYLSGPQYSEEYYIGGVTQYNNAANLCADLIEALILSFRTLKSPSAQEVESFEHAISKYESLLAAAKNKLAKEKEDMYEAFKDLGKDIH